MFGFAIARPATESLFLAAHTSKALPAVWFLVAATVLVDPTSAPPPATGAPPVGLAGLFLCGTF